MSLKLYRVTCKGMQSSHGTAYVVANDPNEAYQVLLAELLRRDLGFARYRELDRVELLADSAEFPVCETALFLPTPAPDREPSSGEILNRIYDFAFDPDADEKEIESMTPEELRAECERIGFTEDKQTALFEKIKAMIVSTRRGERKEGS